jgi:hypothetical protein
LTIDKAADIVNAVTAADDRLLQTAMVASRPSRGPQRFFCCAATSEHNFVIAHRLQARAPTEETEFVASTPSNSVDAVDLERFVERRLRESGLSPLRHVRCLVNDGVLVLYGDVPSYHIKQLAQATVMRLRLPLRVENRCEVESTPVDPFNQQKIR